MKILKYTALVLLIFLLGGIAGVVFERLIMPQLTGINHPFFQKANEKVTVIERTEEIVAKEDYTISKTAQNVAGSVVSIISHPKSLTPDQNISVKTGLIITSDGLIMGLRDSLMGDLPLANLQENFSYKVLVTGGKEFEAKIIAEDPYTDLVFYKIEATNLAAVPLGDSNDLENGEKLVVIGNSNNNGEYQNSFTRSIVFGRDKGFISDDSDVVSSEKMIGAILLGSGINRANVGGPVVDFNGTVIGIANQTTRGEETISFALPINQIKQTIDQVIQNQAIRRTQLGVYYQPINKIVALENDLIVSNGALIIADPVTSLAVEVGSVAQAAGIQAGDIITKIGEQEVNQDNSLSQIIANIAKEEEGKEVVFKVLRAGEEIEVKVML